MNTQDGPDGPGGQDAPGTLDTALAAAWLAAAARAVEEHEQELTALDSAIGDGDHGSNLRRGFTAVRLLLPDPTADPGPPGTRPDGSEPDSTGQDGTDQDSPRDLLRTAGTTLISTVGGASGPLYGSALRAMGAALPDGPADAAQLAAALAAGLAAVQGLGGAVLGDKTMVDALAPAVEAFRAAADRGLPQAAEAAARAAEQGAAATEPLQARKGRASYLGPRSTGHRDPGAQSTALLLRALATAAGAPSAGPPG